ncbi:hypothetical protein [Phytohabitans kaempferiae]|uniref:Helix-turn-helix domain-containing protein n=1 Tax=Phytohabitans kaempferiae TaxID=1620943 RepID=A0ABV6ME87_9ACTN
MNAEDLKTRAQALRAAGNTPKQIARALGVPRAKVTALVRGVRAERPDRAAAEPKPLVGCWITRQWSNGLTIQDRPTDWIDDKELPPLAHGAGLASIAVVREHDHTDVSVCGYLVDTYCLGVKNAVAPTVVGRRHLPEFLADFFAAYPTAPLAAPLSLAQDLVFGAVEYARRLGFDPHHDFRQATPHLDTWEPPSRITFGNHGTPDFQQGPYDNPTRILRTLDRMAGPGNYRHTTVTVGGS